MSKKQDLRIDLQIRPAMPADVAAVYDVCIRTGDIGGDARHLYVDPQMMGHIYAAPYVILAPDLALVVEVDGKVAGYCVGTADTRAFEGLLETAWWPVLRQRYRKPDEAVRGHWTADEVCARMIHEPEPVPQPVAERFPAHLHMDLLPEIQGRGVGAVLWTQWSRLATQAGASAAHVGVHPQNVRARRFWQRLGFAPIGGGIDLSPPTVAWLGCSLPA